MIKMFRNHIFFQAQGDQYLLERLVWPWAQDYSLQHDSFHCETYAKTSAFPTKRRPGPNNFVGAPFALRTSLVKDCPEKCRPKGHKDWSQC